MSSDRSNMSRDNGVPSRDTSNMSRNNCVPSHDNGVPSRDTNNMSRDNGVPSRDTNNMSRDKGVRCLEIKFSGSLAFVWEFGAEIKRAGFFLVFGCEAEPLDVVGDGEQACLDIFL